MPSVVPAPRSEVIPSIRWVNSRTVDWWTDRSDCGTCCSSRTVVVGSNVRWRGISRRMHWGAGSIAEPMLMALVDGLQEEPTLRRLILDLVETDAFLTRPAANDDIMDQEGAP